MNFKLWFLFLFSIKLLMGIEARFEFTNLKCTNLDEEFANFDTCLLKSVNRTYKYMTLKVKLLKIPVKNIKVNIAMVQRLNGYKPFLLNITFDACKYLSNPNFGNAIQKYLVGAFLPYTNMNHPCPFDHDLIVDKLTIEFLNNQFTKIFPAPVGHYGFYTNWFVYGINRADVKAYFTIS